MSSQSAVLVFAGSMVLISLGLAHWVSPWWLLLTTFVGLNLFQSGFTGFCPAELFFRKVIGLKDAGCSTEKPAIH
ncbi:DUF2892 domain-containing protein [soil metagenome]